MKFTILKMFLISVGVFIWLLVFLVAWQMQLNYNFYLWVINQPLLSNFGGASNQIIFYSIGFIIGLAFVLVGILEKKHNLQ